MIFWSALGTVMTLLKTFKKKIMPIYTGKSADGSDMREVEGVYINPDNPNEWSSKMYPQQIRENNIWNQIRDYASGRFSLKDIYNQIQEKKCPLPSRARKYIVELIESETNG